MCVYCIIFSHKWKSWTSSCHKYAEIRQAAVIRSSETHKPHSCVVPCRGEHRHQCLLHRLFPRQSCLLKVLVKSHCLQTSCCCWAVLPPKDTGGGTGLFPVPNPWSRQWAGRGSRRTGSGAQLSTSHCNQRCYLTVPFLALQWLLPSFSGCNGVQISNLKVFLSGPSLIQAWEPGGLALQAALQVGGFFLHQSLRTAALAKQQHAHTEDKHRLENKSSIIWRFMDTAEQALCFLKAFKCLGNKVIMKTSYLTSGQMYC